MNPSTGAVTFYPEGATIPDGDIEVKRPLTTREQTKMKINKYAPCACGSGKLFKFCCFKKS